MTWQLSFGHYILVVWSDAHFDTQFDFYIVFIFKQILGIIERTQSCIL